MLKNSARNCTLTFSDTVVFLNNDRSTSVRPGPLNTPLPKFPYVPRAGSVKAFGLNHWPCRPSTTGPVKEGLREGLSGFLVSPSPDRFAPITGVKGKPLSSVAIPFNCQPPISLFSNPPAFLIQRLPWPTGSS